MKEAQSERKTHVKDDSTDTARLCIRLLGPLEVTLEGAPVIGFATDKVRALLAYLAVEADQSCRRETLAGLLWPDYPERSARASLRAALATLRQAIGDREADPPFLHISRQTVQFNRASDVWVDVRAFTELVDAKPPGEEGVGCLTDAVALYRGDFLEGFSLPDSAPFEEWSLQTGEHLRRRVAEALDRLIDHFQATGQYDAALPYAWRQVELDPWRERTHRQLMHLLAATGQRTAALRQYETCRRVLHEELGVEPSEQTQELHRLLLQDELPLGPGAAGSGPRRPLRMVGACPYRGLSAFQEKDAAFFFGREVFGERLYQAVFERPLVAVIVGSSGSGKSSAVFAGLLPRLRETGQWLLADFRPGGQPFLSLAAALLPSLEPELSETSRLIETRRLAEALDAGELPLSDVLKGCLAANPGSQRLLLLADQFEELYTLCPESETRRQFVDALLASIEPGAGKGRPSSTLLITLRADFMGQALTHRAFADALQEGSLIMGPMTRDELRAAIEKPAARQGAALEEGLVARLLDDVGEEPGNLPLLEFALTLLWERLDDGWMTHAAYEEVGRVEGALARYAEEVFGELDDGERETAQRIFLQLVQPGEGTEDTRRVAKRSELGDAQGNWELVQHLADQRLVVTGRDPTSGDETVEVVHEALIQRWGQFREWIEADRAFRTWQERLRAALRAWETSGRDEGALLRGVPLGEAESWLSERGEELGAAERAYIQAGVQLRARGEAERERRRRRTILGLATGLVIAVVLAAVALMSREQAHQSAISAQANADARATAQAEAEAAEHDALLQASVGLAAKALAELEGTAPERAVLLALEALEYYPYTSQAESALAHIVEQYLPHLDLEHRPDPILASGAAWAPDGDRIAAIGTDDRGWVVIWDAETGNQLLDIPLAVYCMGVDVAWSPSGDRLVTIFSPYGEVTDEACLVPQIWDAATGGNLLAFTGHADQVNSVDWSPDGTSVLTSSEDGSARVWDPDLGAELMRISGHAGAVNDAVWSPDGQRFVTASADGTAKVWDAVSGAEQWVLPGHSGGVNSADWSPDGERVVTVSDDGLARVWRIPRIASAPASAAIGELLLSLSGHSGEVLGVDWSSDGAYIATASIDGTAKVWDAATGEELNTIYEVTAKLGSVAWSPNSSRLIVSASLILPVWDVSNRPLRLSGHTDNVWGPVWSPDGRLIATTSWDHTARIWDATTGEALLTLETPDGLTFSAWSPDGTRLLTAGFDGTARVWDVSAGEVLVSVSRPKGNHFQIASWSPDGGRFVASSYPDKISTIYDGTSGEELVTFGEGVCVLHRPSWSPDGTQIATGCPYAIEDAFPDGNSPAFIWDAETGKTLATLSSHDGETVCVEWSPDGGSIVAGYESGAVKIWDVATAKVVLTFAGHAAQVWDVSWSPDGTRVASGDAEGAVKVWDAGTGDEVLGFTAPGMTVSVDWSPDGKSVSAGGFYHTPVIHRAWQSTEELIAYARDCCVPRELTPEERVQFGLPER